MGKLFTVGHSTNELSYFLNLLKTHNINYVLDVRSTPYSRYAAQFNSDRLKAYLAEKDIKYSFMGNYFGARQQDKSLYHKDGYLDFEKVRASEKFIKGENNVILGLKTNNIALMCTEKHPFDCHRAIMVARGFELSGVKVSHILNDGTLFSQEQLNQMLLDKYFPDRGQLSLFDYLGETSQDNYLVEAYRKRNKEIGYRLGSESEGER